MYNHEVFIRLPNITLEVARSCSGVRYLISYIVFGILYAYLTRNNLIKRIAIVLLTIPMALLAGMLRLTVIATAAYYIDPVLASHTPHIIISWAVFSIVLIMALWFDGMLQSRRWLKWKSEEEIK